MDVVTKEPGSAAVQAARTPGKAIRIDLRFRDVVPGTDCNRAERPRMGIRCSLVIHGNIEET